MQRKCKSCRFEGKLMILRFPVIFANYTGKNICTTYVLSVSESRDEKRPHAKSETESAKR